MHFQDDFKIWKKLEHIKSNSQIKRRRRTDIKKKTLMREMNMHNSNTFAVVWYASLFSNVMNFDKRNVLITSIGFILGLQFNNCILFWCWRSRSNAKICLQSCSNTNELVRYDNIPQSTLGVTSTYASLTIANDCQTYDDLMPTGGTYENTTTMSTNYKQSTQDKKHKKRRKEKTNKMI